MTKLRVPAFVLRFSNLPVVIPFTIAAAYIFWLIQVHAIPSIPGFSGIVRNLPDMMLTYAPSSIYQKLVSFGPDGRIAYRLFLTRVDSIFPVIYGVFFLTATTYALVRAFPNRPAMHTLGLFTVGCTLFDYAENFCFLRMLSAFPQELPALARLANTFTLIKWVFAFFSFGLVIFSVSALFARFLRRSRLAPVS
jgi:hypothetical protein